MDIRRALSKLETKSASPRTASSGLILHRSSLVTLGHTVAVWPNLVAKLPP
jgi:hypothetical protein